jgi:hypothetical protein
MSTLLGLPLITAGIYILVQWPQLLRGVSIWFLSGVQLLYLMVLFNLGEAPECLVTPLFLHARVGAGRLQVGTLPRVRFQPIMQRRHKQLSPFRDSVGLSIRVQLS